MRKITWIIFIALLYSKGFAQLTGVINIPSTYTSIALAIQALNQQGISGHVTVAIIPGHTETAPVNGYSLIATGNSTSSITFQKSGTGANPLISSYSGGSGTPGTLNQDGIWRLVGSDYITIDGIDLVDLNSSNPQTMEFGFGLFKLNGIDGCQHNTIKNCVITLNLVNNAAGNSPAADGSRGINMVNSTSSANTSALTIFSADGSNSYNKFYSNNIQNCNIGIALIGFADVSPFFYADKQNDVGGNSIATGNSLINFGGGGTVSASAGIRTLAQYDLNVSYNVINNNTGSGINHPGIIRGIYLNTALSANAVVNSNTLTISGGGLSSQVSVIENASGSVAASNTISIINNVITNCNYSTSVSGAFYAIYNTGSPANLNISTNILSNNSTASSSGSTYLIYNTGAVPMISINNNKLSFNYDGPLSYTGTMYNIYNTASMLSGTLSISNNSFSNYNHLNVAGTGPLYFIYNSGDFSSLSMNGNNWKGLLMNHNGIEYFMYNTSSTQHFLSVSDNTITNHIRNGTSVNTYCYYGAATSPGTAIHTFSNNLFSNISSIGSGPGNFYGIYNSEGNTSPYPKKKVFNNVIRNINMNGTGTMYGIYISDAGDAGTNSGSEIYNNAISDLNFADAVYGLYSGSPTSPVFATDIYSNTIYNINSDGTAANAYGSVLGSNNAGALFYKNRISDIKANGSTGSAYGVYCIANNSILIFNNSIANIKAPASTGANRVNGIFISAGSIYNIFYNSVYLNANSTGTAFGSNAIYASTTATVDLRNNIFINNSTATGPGICTAYRRSSGNLTSYSTNSDNNLFYAGTPGTSNLIFYNGTTSYQTLANFQTAMGTREANSVTQNINFLSTHISSPNFLHVVPNVFSFAESGASLIAGITEDQDNEIRYGNMGYAGSGTAPDIGADEFEQDLHPCNSVNAGNISVSITTICAGQIATLLSSGYTSGTGVSHQWKVGTQVGGPYFNVAGGSGATGIEYATGALIAGTYYFILETTCSNISQSASSNQATLVINPVPSALASISSSLVCSGQFIVLNGSSNTGINYNWTGPYGFNSSVSNPTLVNVKAGASGVYSLQVTANNCTSPASTVVLTVSEVTITINSSASFLCAGNTSTLTANSSATSYSWNTGALSHSIVVAPGLTNIYSVTATNTSNCNGSASITISVINPTISGVNVLACGLTPTVVISANAFSPSVISWYASPSSTLVLYTGSNYTLNPATSATLYPEANSTGCSSPRIPLTVSVSSNPTLTITASPATVCPGKPSILLVSGANTYSWTGLGSGSSKTVSPMLNTIYTVQGTDLPGCKSTNTISVETYSLPVVNTAQSTTITCPSSSVTFTATGAVSYTWSTGTTGAVANVSPAINSTYIVYGSSAEACISTATLAVVTRSVPVISIAQSSTNVCPEEAVTFTASGAVSYTWLPGNVISNTYTASPLVSAVFNVIGKSINTCTAVGFASVFTDGCVGINENFSFDKSVFVFPNPSKGLITFEFNFEGKKNIKILNLAGKLAHESEINLISASLDFTILPKGFYFVVIESGNYTSTLKLILN